MLSTTNLQRRFFEALPANLNFCSMRVVDERSELLSISKNIIEPPVRKRDVGAMITVHHGGGLGYAATADLSSTGISHAIQRACEWAAATTGRMVFDPAVVRMPIPLGNYNTSVECPWEDLSLSERLDRMMAVSRSLPIDPRIIQWKTSILAVEAKHLYLTSDGGEVNQTLNYLSPEIEVYAHENGMTQCRTLGGQRGASQQGGAEILTRFRYDQEGLRIARQAIELIEAPVCPSGVMDVVLAPDQMMLQIHESIGHPIEIDRILGDERNYAGTSFVTLDMFGHYRYGSELLNVSFDPGISNELASYGFDDEGSTAQSTRLIENGILKAGLGGEISQARSGLPGVANSRASTWNRPPIDRMANLNIEPGDRSLLELINACESGVYLETNLSWSIDDSRNKFQFGCEYGHRIVEGQLGEVVRNCNYRGVSASFWRNLVGVGDPSTMQILGTPHCGKGEPNQVIRVGHASPACRFRDVEVFGGEA